MRCLALLSALCAFATPSLAAIVEFRFSGVIETVDDPDNYFGGLVQVGDPFLARFFFDPNQPDLEPVDQTLGTYSLMSPKASVILPNISGQGSSLLRVMNPNPFYDIDQLHFDGISSMGNWAVRFSGPNTTFDNDQFPTELPDLPYEFGMARPGGIGSGLIYGTVTSAMIVPEPTSILVLSCLGALILSSGRSLRGRVVRSCWCHTHALCQQKSVIRD